MLGKLLKHEFRATGRTMLPVLGVLAVLVVLANVSVRYGDALAEQYQLVAVLFILLIFLTIIAVIAAEIMPIIVMVQRFYKNLLGGEGYLMHTLPANVHELVWSKLIVSLVWMLATNLVIVLLGGLSLLHLGELSVGEILNAFPSGEEIRRALAEIGIVRGDVTLFLVELVVGAVLTQLATCLHFYAAMALGHMFSKDKVLLSVVFFIGFNVLFSLFTSAIGMGAVGRVDNMEILEQTYTAGQSFRVMARVLGESLGFTFFQAVVYYVATVLGLKKGLNLA